MKRKAPKTWEQLIYVPKAFYKKCKIVKKDWFRVGKYYACALTLKRK